MTADTGLAFAPGWLETLSDFFRLFEVFRSGVPEEQAAGNPPDRERHPQLSGHAQEAVFHGRGTRPLRKRDAGGGVVECLDFFLAGVVELRVHPGASPHGAGFC